MRAEGLLVDLRRLRAAGDALAAEAEARKCFGGGGGGAATGGGGDGGGCGPQRPASPAALPSRPSSTESLAGAATTAEKRGKKKIVDPAVEQYLGELSRLRAEADKAFSGGQQEGERAAAA